MNPEVSILVPCRNESERLAPLLQRLEDTCIASDLDVETIILDDGSADNTLEVAASLRQKHRALEIRIVRRFEPRRGYGAVVRYGMAHARGQYCLLLSSDGTPPLEMLPKMIGMARQGAQLVQMSRYERPEDTDNLPLRIKLYGRLYLLFARMLLGLDFRDPTCSFKLFDRVHMLALGASAKNLSIIPEISLKIALSGGKVVYFPGKQVFREKGISQARFLRESTSYAYVLARAVSHRLGIWSWF